MYEITRFCLTLLVTTAFVFAVENVLEKCFSGVVVVQFRWHCDAQIRRCIPSAMGILESDTSDARIRIYVVAMMQRHCTYFRIRNHHQFTRFTGKMHHLQIFYCLTCTRKFRDSILLSNQIFFYNRRHQNLSEPRSIILLFKKKSRISWSLRRRKNQSYLNEQEKYFFSSQFAAWGFVKIKNEWKKTEIECIHWPYLRTCTSLTMTWSTSVSESGDLVLSAFRTRPSSVITLKWICLKRYKAPNEYSLYITRDIILLEMSLFYIFLFPLPTIVTFF